MRLLASLTEVDKASPIKGFGNIISYGGQMLLIGMLTVFSVLCIIWLALTLFKYVFQSNANSQNKEQDTKEVEQTAPSNASKDEELVAVIAAAIAAAESENSGVKFRVVSFTRK